MKYLQSAKRLSGHLIELLYILIDFSGSMDSRDYSPSRREGAIQANIKLIETKARLHPEDRVGIIGFSGKAYLLHEHVPVGRGAKSLYQCLEKDVGGGRTNFTAALKLAEKHLLDDLREDRIGPELSRFFRNLLIEDSDSGSQESSHSAKKINKRIIMLTDGKNTGLFNPVKVADRLKDSGVTIECVGIAGKPRSVGERVLKQIASKDQTGTPMYYFINDTSNLVRKYESMAHHIRPV
jgi:hypothetical protein